MKEIDLIVVISIGYSTIETKEADCIGYNGFLFPHEYSGEGRGFVSIIMYLTCTIIVLLKKYMAYVSTLLMFRKPNKTTINKNKTTNFYRSTSFRFSFIFRYSKVFQVKRIVYI